VRLAPAVRSGPILALGAVLLGTTGAAILPRAAQGELQRPEAAFLAGQHRLCTPREGLFHHALRLLPWLNEDEVAPFVLGWGLHMGREYAAQLPSLLVQLQDAWPQPDAHPPGLADPLLRRTDPHFWWTPVAALARPLALAYASGLGLGVAEDGLLEAADLALIEAAPDFARMALWEGVGAAMGERATWAGDLAAPRVDGPAPAVDLAAFTRGHRATAPPGQGPPPGWVDPAESGRIELPMAHPFTYAYAVAGRGGPRGSGGGGGHPAPSPAPTP
jgi:hypothetical protein